MIEAAERTRPRAAVTTGEEPWMLRALSVISRELIAEIEMNPSHDMAFIISSISVEDVFVEKRQRCEHLVRIQIKFFARGKRFIYINIYQIAPA